MPEPMIIAIFVALFLLALLLKSPWFKGVMGEKVVSAALRRHLDEAEYVILNDLTLPARNGTTQIDHVVMSRFGLFVIETKNMKGWIFGEADQARWTQVVHRKKARFQNPLRQNYGHVKTVQTLLGLEDHQVHNVVAFVGDARPKTKMPTNVVWSPRALRKFIQSHTETVIAPEQVQTLAERLKAHQLEPGRSTRAAHVAQVRARQAERGPLGTACPDCGSDMVMRTARKTGERFFGCVSYPRCRGTRVLTGDDRR